jgi:hypothetical protein
MQPRCRAAATAPSRVAHALESLEAGVVAVVGDAIFNDCNEVPASAAHHGEGSAIICARHLDFDLGGDLG